MKMVKTRDYSKFSIKLIDYGWVYYILRNYKDGKISIGKAAKELKLTITEIIELLADLGIKSLISYEDYLEGQKFAEEIL